MSYGEKTKGFSGAYFKELFILKNLRKCTIEKAISILQSQILDIEKSGAKKVELDKAVKWALLNESPDNSKEQW